MKKRKLLSLLLITVFVVASIAACGKKDPDPTKGADATPTAAAAAEPKAVTLRVWSSAEDQAPQAGFPDGLLKKWLDDFAAAHPEYILTWELGTCGEDNAYAEISKDSDKAPDVFEFANDQIPKFTAAGLIAQLGGSYLEALKKDNSQSMIDSVTYEGKFYGFPYQPNTVELYYDSSKFTAEDVKSLNTMLEKDLGTGIYNFASEITNAWHIEQYFFAADGFTLFGPNGTDADAGTNVSQYTFVTDFLIDLKANPKFHVESSNDSISLFKDGKLGALIDGDWNAKDIKAALGDNFAVAQLPAITFSNGQTGLMKQFTGSKAVGVKTNASDPVAATQLAQYLGSAQVQLDRFKARGTVPVSAELANNPDIAADPIALAEAAVVANTSVAQPLVSTMENWWTPAGGFGEAINNGDITHANAEEKTKQFEDAVNAATGLQ